MSQPTPYTRQYNFRNFQTVNPTVPLPGDKVDIEFNAVRGTLDQTLANLRLIQRDDGRLANGSVGVSQMDGSLISLGFERPTNWATATSYVVDSAVFQSNKLYICLVAHTSSVFATDLANGKWVETIDFTSLITDAQAAATAAQGYAADAQAAAAAAAVQFTLCVLKAGSTMTGELTLTGAGSQALHAATIGQVQSNIFAQAATVGGTGDAIVITFSPVFTAWTAGMRFRFTATAANTVTNPTANVDSNGVKTIKKLNNAALAAGDIKGAGHVCDCVYNGTDVILLNPATIDGSVTNTFSAAQTFSGKVTNSGPVIHGRTTLTDAATIAWDLSTGGPDYEVTIAGNRTLGAFTGSTDGQEGLLHVIEDATGGRTLDLSNAAYKWYGGFIENVVLGANDRTIYEYKVVSGSMWLRRRGATSIGGPKGDLLAVSAASASATIDFVLTKWAQLYDAFEVEFDDVRAATDDTQFWLRTSTDGGATYDSVAAGYQWVLTRNGLGLGASNSTGDAQMVLINNDGNAGLSNVAGETATGCVRISNPRTAQKCKLTWSVTYLAEGGGDIEQVLGVGCRKAAADVDAIRFMTSSGNITSGSFRLYGIRK